MKTEGSKLKSKQKNKINRRLGAQSTQPAWLCSAGDTGHHREVEGVPGGRHGGCTHTAGHETCCDVGAGAKTHQRIGSPPWGSPNITHGSLSTQLPSLRLAWRATFMIWWNRSHNQLACSGTWLCHGASPPDIMRLCSRAQNYELSELGSPFRGNIWWGAEPGDPSPDESGSLKGSDKLPCIIVWSQNN